MQECRSALGWNADKDSGSSETGNLEHVGIRNLLSFPVNFNSFEKKKSIFQIIIKRASKGKIY